MQAYLWQNEERQSEKNETLDNFLILNQGSY